jgi:hypothetical protein
MDPEFVRLSSECCARYLDVKDIQGKIAQVLKSSISYGTLNGKPTETAEYKIQFDGDSRIFIISPQDCIPV